MLNGLNEADTKWVNEIWSKLISKLSDSAERLADIIPYKMENSKYIDMAEKDVSWWTNGFFGGMMWLMYKSTGNDIYRHAAERQERLLDEAWSNYKGFQHDVGFMWGLTSRANYEETGNERSRVQALNAANFLAARVNIKDGFIRAWDTVLQYSIIDTMMNLSLLYWALRETKDDRYRYIAEMHADMALKYHICNDGRAVPIVNHKETENGIIETLGGQGYKDGSAWKRGQAWALYGFALSYIHTGYEKYLDASKSVADYFLRHAEKSNYKILTDFLAPPEPVLYDNSAGMCAACGLIELYKITSNMKYLSGAINILRAAEEECIFDSSNDSIIQKCMESYGCGVHTDLIYADFYLCEAISKLRGDNFLLW